MINLKYTYQPSHSLDEVNTQVTNLVELLKNELLQAATNENVEAVTLKVEQTSDDGLQRIAQVQAAVGDTAAKVGMLATYNQATGSITVSAALVNGIEQSDIVLSGDQITLNGNVTIANNFKLTGDHITANTITSTQIASATITANEIAGNTITAAEIATGAITADEIAAHTITAAEIATNYIYAGSIDASQITAGTIDAARIDASSISVQSLINGYGNRITFGSGIIIPGMIDTEITSVGVSTGYLMANIIAARTSGGSVTFNSDVNLNYNVFADGVAAATAQSSNPNVRCQDNTHRLALISGSSKRFKHDIKPIEEKSLDPHNLYDVQVVQFIYNDDYLSSNDPRYEKPIAGFIAEDINEVYPIACDVEEGGTRPNDWNVRYIVPPMLALIQEQNERIKRLEARYGE